MAQEPANPYFIVTPYFLHASDHRGLNLVSRSLMELNFNSWSRFMKMALNSKRKLGFVDGSIPKPDADADPDLIAAWQCNNDIVFSWLLNSISKDIVESVIYTDSATMLWRNLHDRFRQANGPRMYELKQALVNLHQGSLTVTQYFTKIKNLWEELIAFRPSIHCDCGGVHSLNKFL